MSILHDQNGLVSLDRDQKVWYDEANEVLHVDGVCMSLQFMVGLVNPDSSKYFRAQRKGDNVLVTQYTRGALMTELGVPSPPRSELDVLAHGLAYTAAASAIESSCVVLGDGWFGLDDVDGMAKEHVDEAAKYLEMRGLLERDPDRRDVVAIRNESEA